jgi:hypothetical protein
MPEVRPAPLDNLRPAVKARWTSLLRSQPFEPGPHPTIIHPAMFDFMLDDTLDRLSHRLRTAAGTDQSRNDLAPLDANFTCCRCGLRLLLNYYVTGTQALRDSLPADPDPTRTEVLRLFRRIAEDEITALCGVCRHRGGPTCGLPPAPTGAGPVA